MIGTNRRQRPIPRRIASTYAVVISSVLYDG